jgi:hypothetical protein
MCSLVSISSETCGDTKVEFEGFFKQQQVLTTITNCKITWFQHQKTVHLWFAAPAVYNKHAITMFQKFQGTTFQDVIDHYMQLFYKVTWLFVPVVQKKRSLDMLPFLLDDMDEQVASLVRCLVFVKNNVAVNSKHGFKHQAGHWKKRVCSRYRVDDRGTN